MHPEGILNCEKFVRKYLDPKKKLTIVDIGSFNINGTLKPLFTHNGVLCNYCGDTRKLEPEKERWCSCYTCYAKEPMKRGWLCDGINFRPMGLKNEELGPGWEYFGLETEAACLPYGNLLDDDKSRYNVSIIAKDPHSYPITSNTIDVIVSSSCFEHDDLFWVTFKEMSRVLKTGGLMYLDVPSSGPYHGYPLDCWRFQKDSYIALSRWCPELELLESWIDTSATWWDNIGVFRKRA